MDSVWRPGAFRITSLVRCLINEYALTPPLNHYLPSPYFVSSSSRLTSFKTDGRQGLDLPYIMNNWFLNAVYNVSVEVSCS